ncbi:MAG TPA: class I SAM-dependent methyltransferase, partial [Acidobacteriota bacterium]|nr:class I SAM-dependent methyltransferase [Acidobacteriota bacterium]
TSVFTHMLPPDLRHYIAEIARVLRPGRRCLLTLFLLDDVASGLVAAGGGLPRFSFPLDGAPFACRIADRRNPEAAIAYPEADLLEWLSAGGLPAVPPIHYGTWSGRADGRWYQDVLVVERVQDRDHRCAAADSSCPTA